MGSRSPAPAGVAESISLGSFSLSLSLSLSLFLPPLLPPTITFQPHRRPSPPSSLHPCSSVFSYGSKRVINEIQARPTRDHRGIKPAVQFSAGVLVSGIRGRIKLRISHACFIVVPMHAREVTVPFTLISRNLYRCSMNRVRKIGTEIDFSKLGGSRNNSRGR